MFFLKKSKKLFFSIFFVLTDHFNSKYMFYDSFGLNSRKKKFYFIKKIFPQKFEGGGHFDNAQNCQFFAMEVIFRSEMAESAELYFSGHFQPPIIITIFFFEIG